MGFLKRLFGKDKKKSEDNQATPENAQPEEEKEATEPEAAQEKSKRPDARDYHVSLNKDKDSENYNMWRVRKEQSDKTIKFFRTQKEAIDYAEDLAKESDSDVVIHKTDGSIRKQNYKK